MKLESLFTKQGEFFADYLVTVAIYQNARIDTPGNLTMLRSALTNTTTLAFLAVENGLHKELLFTDQLVNGQIEKFAYSTYAKFASIRMTSNFLDKYNIGFCLFFSVNLTQSQICSYMLDCAQNMVS